MRQIKTQEILLITGGKDGNSSYSNGGRSPTTTKSSGTFSRDTQCAASVIGGAVLGGAATRTPAGVIAGAAAGYGSSSSCSRVICTHFYRKGMLDQAIWRADMAFTFKNLSPATIRGYQFWAIPYVRLMRKSTMAEKFMFPLAKWRAQELAYQMGVVSKGSWRGRLVRLTCEPICWALGVLVGEQNWQSLYEPAK